MADYEGMGTYLFFTKFLVFPAKIIPQYTTHAQNWSDGQRLDISDFVSSRNGLASNVDYIYKKNKNKQLSKSSENFIETFTDNSF